MSDDRLSPRQRIAVWLLAAAFSIAVWAGVVVGFWLLVFRLAGLG